MTKYSLRQIIQVLNEAEVRYLVVGGIAVIVHGYLRSTTDVDLLIHLEASNILKGLEALATLGFRPTIPVTFADFANAQIREAWRTEKQMNVLKLFCDAHRETPIDVFVYDPLGFDEAYRRAKYYRLAGSVDVPVCAYEDLVRLKQLAGRPQDLADIDQLRIARGEL